MNKFVMQTKGPQAPKYCIIYEANNDIEDEVKQVCMAQKQDIPLLRQAYGQDTWSAGEL